MNAAKVSDQLFFLKFFGLPGLPGTIFDTKIFEKMIKSLPFDSKLNTILTSFRYGLFRVPWLLDFIVICGK